jgi:hypothetical protein
MFQHSDPALDGVMVFGFIVAFLTLVCLLYRHDFKTRFPLLPILFSGSAAYGFLVGAWPLGFVLCAVAIGEFRQWWKRPVSIDQPRNVAKMRIEKPVNVCESRMSRMFGR